MVPGKQRLALAAGLVALIAALALGVLALVPGLVPQLGGGNPNRLATQLSQTIASKGIEAAAEQYRTLRAQGFQGVIESEADTNTLGYALLNQGHVADAIRILQLNVETHPSSANAVAAVLAVALVRIGLDVAAGRLSRAGAPSGVFFVFAMIAALAAALDLRMIRRGALAGTPRLTRHLWRMCTGLFVAVGSFFLGQPQVFPATIRNSGLLVVPPLLVVFTLGYWLLRVPILRVWPQPSYVPGRHCGEHRQSVGARETSAR